MGALDVNALAVAGGGGGDDHKKCPLCRSFEGDWSEGYITKHMDIHRVEHQKAREDIQKREKDRKNKAARGGRGQSKSQARDKRNGGK